MLRIAPILALLALSLSAGAYETDQLTSRQIAVPDVSAEVDGYVNQALEQARAETERHERRSWSRDRIAQELRARIEARFPMDPLYFGAPIEKWMTETLGREGYAVETAGRGHGWGFNIYDQYPVLFDFWRHPGFMGPALVFSIARHVAGTYIAPTYVSNGIRFGADKLSHFFRLGYRYYLHSHGGKDVPAALHYGTMTEMGDIGYDTSGAFSYGDLASDYAGFQFFLAVTGGPDPYFEINDKGEIRQLRPFRLEDYVTDDWDEYLNPCVYQAGVERIVRLHLRKYRARVCAEYAQWRDTSARPARPLLDKPVYVDMKVAPAQKDPFRLDELCGNQAP